MSRLAEAVPDRSERTVSTSTTSCGEVSVLQRYAIAHGCEAPVKLPPVADSERRSQQHRRSSSLNSLPEDASSDSFSSQTSGGAKASYRSVKGGNAGHGSSKIDTAIESGSVWAGTTIDPEDSFRCSSFQLDEEQAPSGALARDVSFLLRKRGSDGNVCKAPPQRRGWLVSPRAWWLVALVLCTLSSAALLLGAALEWRATRAAGGHARASRGDPSHASRPHPSNKTGSHLPPATSAPTVAPGVQQMPFVVGGEPISRDWTMSLRAGIDADGDIRVWERHVGLNLEPSTHTVAPYTGTLDRVDADGNGFGTLHGCSATCTAAATARAVSQLSPGTIGWLDNGPTVVIISVRTSGWLRNASIGVIGHCEPAESYVRMVADLVQQMGSETFEPPVQLRLASTARKHI